MKQQDSDDGSDWTEEEVIDEEGGGGRQDHVRPKASKHEGDETVFDSPVGSSAANTIRICSANESGSTSNSGGKNAVTISTTPKKSNGYTSTTMSDDINDNNINSNSNMNDLKTPTMSSSSKRPPSKSPGTSKSPARSALNKSPKMPPLVVATASLSPPPSATPARKPERQLSFANGLTISQHSHSTKGRSSIDSTRTTTTSATSTATNASTSQSRRCSRRKVQWKKSVRVNVIPNLSYFSTQEKLLTWYTADEYSLMEDECDLTSECLDARKPLWPGFCARGLESWTLDGEQRKEQHVQLAIDIVWQAQLDQWRQASNTDECWEFIRSQYLQVSKQCLKLANQLAQADEREIQPYLSSVKALEKSRRKMLGLRSRSSSRGGSSSSSKRIIRRGKVVRTVSDTTAIEKQILSQSAHGPNTRRSPRRCLSDMPSTPTKPVLRPAIKYTDDDWDQTPVAGSNRGGRRGKSRSASDAIGYVTEDNDDDETNNTYDDDDDDDTDGSSTLASSIVEAYSNKKKLANKKIEFKPKSKTKVPTSPVGSLAASITTTDSSSIIRRMRSHLSVASDESTRRRITRTAAMKVPL
ncbi:hypothetical protein IV203_019077 [Nitzschia inconspicua]|uniref:Uncharacterized protein n=1 Tax=Nitzschia inconspicua TaxID=303405 RepID=A0A9K3LYH9_9STRA|nr:hypothetical protein IV203_019077 [Nitzschia inconspicua]